jgi:drug/metabolite transporter (DMT)-like permease
MFYFRFRNPASWPHVFPKLKEYLPRLLGAAALLLVAGALFKASLSYTPWISGPGATLLGLTALFVLLAAAFVYLTTRRRSWFARWIGPRPQDLRSLRELTWQAWLPLVLAAVLGFALMVLLAYQAVAIARPPSARRPWRCWPWSA